MAWWTVLISLVGVPVLTTSSESAGIALGSVAAGALLKLSVTHFDI